MSATVCEESIDAPPQEAEPTSQARQPSRAEEDEQDWCAWWAAYSELME